MLDALQREKDMAVRNLLERLKTNPQEQHGVIVEEAISDFVRNICRVIGGIVANQMTATMTNTLESTKRSVTCNKCGRVMKFTGRATLSDPPMFIYACDCGHVARGN